MSKPETVSVGGQAVIEGVMMRSTTGWAVAARTPKGGIVAQKHELPRLSSRSFLAKVPFIRGVLVLGESMTLGMRALTWSANVQAAEEEEELGGGALFASVAAALLLTVGIFIVAPSFAAKVFASGNDIAFGVIEVVIRLGLFIGYLWAIGQMSDVKRVFQYHGAEHKTIHAYEAGDPLSVQEIQKYSPAHPRCGTSFLLLVLLISSVVFAAIGDIGFLLVVVSRLLLIPVIGGVSYELLRFSGARSDGLLARSLARPGLWLQRLTTGEPEDDLVEVAVASLLAALDDEARDEVVSRGGIPTIALEAEVSHG
jgi:uncharacterized protein YqhQ